MLNLDTARDWYPVDDPVHGYDHIVRVYHLAKRLAAVEGADIEIVRAAALLHDAQGELDERADHQQSAANFTQQVLREESWPEDRIAAVLHCIRAHRYRDEREQPETLEARVIFDADKLDAIGAIGVARAIAYAVKGNQPIYAQPSDLFLRTGVPHPGEPHSAYHEYVYKLRNLIDRLYTRAGRELAQPRHQIMSDYFERLAEEWRTES